MDLNRLKCTCPLKTPGEQWISFEWLGVPLYKELIQDIKNFCYYVDESEAFFLESSYQVQKSWMTSLLEGIILKCKKICNKHKEIIIKYYQLSKICNDAHNYYTNKRRKIHDKIIKLMRGEYEDALNIGYIEFGDMFTFSFKKRIKYREILRLYRRIFVLGQHILNLNSFKRQAFDF